MTKRRWPVIVEVRKTRARKSPGSQAREIDHRATLVAETHKPTPETPFPVLGPLAQEILSACRGQTRFPQKLW
jgi:hypothetical protein